MGSTWGNTRRSRDNSSSSSGSIDINNITTQTLEISQHAHRPQEKDPEAKERQGKVEQPTAGQAQKDHRPRPACSRQGMGRQADRCPELRAPRTAYQAADGDSPERRGRATACRVLTVVESVYKQASAHGGGRGRQRRRRRGDVRGRG